MNRSSIFALFVCTAAIATVAHAQEHPDESRVVSTAAGEQYQAGLLHRWILGRHYRDLWTAPVRVELLDLDAVGGGLTPTRTGGGMQTRSLRFAGADGREYAFRSVDKDPSPVLDSILRGTVVADLVQDGISAAHPYGALVAAPLLDAVGVLHVDPQLRVMPDDPALGEFREEFAGMLGLVEERPDENEGDRTSFQGTTRVIASETLTERLDRGPNDRVDAEAYLRARIMDVFLGDWDRHRGQWRWATFDEEAPRRWLPVPRDRDQAFSKFDGLATRIVSLYLPQFVRFEKEYPSLRRLHWNARAIDRWFLAELDRDDWDRVGRSVQSALTDDVIEQAVFRLPLEILELNGEELGETLRARRDRLGEAWTELYELMSKNVDLRLTDEDELVHVERSAAEVTVRVTAPERSSDPYLERRFLPGETSEIRILMREGDDRVVVTGFDEPGILIRVVGGEDDDTFELDGVARRLRLYDDHGETESLGFAVPNVDTRSWDQWEWSEDDRNQPVDWGGRTLPIFWTSYSTDLGVFLGAGVRFERYGFRKVPYASAFDLRAGWAPQLGKGRLELDGEFRRQNSAVFWPVQARISRLDVLHDYGIGNDSPGGPEAFHRVDVTTASAEAGMGLSFSSGIDLSGRVRIERTSTQDNSGRFFDSRRPVYGDGGFTSLGLLAVASWDPWAASSLRASRIRILAEGALYPGLLDVNRRFGTLGARVSGLVADHPWPRVALAYRGGVGQVYGDFPWHKAAFLGGAESLRGWDEQRFAGDAVAWAGAELRLSVVRPRVVVPISVGVFGFADAGRVSIDGDSSGGWHAGSGGGLFLQPIQQPYIFRLGVGKGSEATRVYATLGLPY